jgi:HlyD family secretion protein
MNSKLWMIIGGVLAALVVLGLLAGTLASGVAVDATAARVDTIREFVDERGKTRLPRTYLITMPYAGRIEPITLEEDDVVAKGDVVARISSEDLELAIAQAEADLQQAEASLGEIRYDAIEKTAADQADDFVESMKAIVSSAVEQARASKAALVYAEKDLARVRELFPSGARTQSDVDEAVREHSQSDAGYRQSLFTHAATKAMDAATARLPAMIAQYVKKKQLTSKVLEARKNRADVLLQIAELDRQRGTMKSPVDGVVLKRHVTNQRELAAGTVLLEIGQADTLQVEADLLSLDMGQVKSGQTVEIHGPAIGRPPAMGTVTRTFPAGFTKVSSLGVEQQRVKVIVRFDEKDLKRLRAERNLGIGYRVRVRIFTDKKDKALVIPRSALFRGPKGTWQLYAIRGGNATLQEVEVGLMNDDTVEILKGIKSGEQVILAPESNLENGVRVSPR